MKTTLLKSTLMALLFAFSANVMAQPTTAAPTPPEYAASKVLSIYSDAFTPATGWNFGVWESGSSYSQIQVEGDNVAQFNQPLSICSQFVEHNRGKNPWM